MSEDNKYLDCRPILPTTWQELWRAILDDAERQFAAQYAIPSRDPQQDEGAGMSERYEPSGPPDSTMVALLQSENEALRGIIRDATGWVEVLSLQHPREDAQFHLKPLLERMRAAAGEKP